MTSLMKTARKFYDCFKSMQPDARFLGSRKDVPGIYWQHNNLPNFVQFSQWPDDSQLIRMETNADPIEAVYALLPDKYLKSFYTLDQPIIELMALPSEMPSFGYWLSNWFTAYKHNSGKGPINPHAMYYIYTNGNLENVKCLYDRHDTNWKEKTYLWTVAAHDYYNKNLVNEYGKL